MSNALAHAWGWSIRRSPLLFIVRSLRTMRRPNRDAFAMLDNADLPEPIDETIRRTIDRTKLWRDERAQIAKELIAHAQDAIDAGRSPEQVVESFGNPRRVARLLRRSMKRKRPAAWKLYWYSRRAMAVLCVVLVLGYGWLAFRFFFSSPSINVNYAAMLDARNDGYREDQKSWRVIMEAGFQWRVVCEPFGATQTAEAHGVDPMTYQEGWLSLPGIATDHPDYAQMVEAVDAFEPMLAQVRDAASRPVFGLPVAYATVQEQVGTGQADRSVVPADDDEYKERSTIDILLPHLGPSRQLAQVLHFNARVAMRRGEVEQAVSDYIASMNLARQCQREPFLIAHLVGIAIHQACIKEIEWAVREFPGAFDSEQLARIAHVHARVDGGRSMGLDTERYVFNDFLQRVYTDDGNGDGHITAEGAAWLRQWTSSFNHEDAGGIPAFVADATNPIGLVFSNSRAEELRFYNEGMDQIERVLEKGPEWLPLIQELEAQIEIEKAQSDGVASRFSVVGVMMPALGSSVSRYFIHEQARNGFEIMLAIEAYRSENGRLPDSLDQLTPRYLPEVPADLMDPGGVVKYAIEGDRYVLYSVGSDGDDDQATRIPDDQSQQIRDVRSFGLRYTQVRSMTNEPVFEAGGKPAIAAPQGPEGDWILIDTRPSPDRAGDS